MSQQSQFYSQQQDHQGYSQFLDNSHGYPNLHYLMNSPSPVSHVTTSAFPPQGSRLDAALGISNSSEAVSYNYTTAASGARFQVSSMLARYRDRLTQHHISQAGRLSSGDMDDNDTHLARRNEDAFRYTESYGSDDYGPIPTSAMHEIVPRRRVDHPVSDLLIENYREHSHLQVSYTRASSIPSSNNLASGSHSFETHLIEDDPSKRSDTDSLVSVDQSLHDSLGQNVAPKKKSKMHECEICHKKFPRPSGLKTHMNMHNNEKPFPCGFPGCTRTFGVRSNARRHIRQHGVVPSTPSQPETPYVVGFSTPTVAQTSFEITKVDGIIDKQEHPTTSRAPVYKVRWMPLSTASYEKTIIRPKNGKNDIADHSLVRAFSPGKRNSRGHKNPMKTSTVIGQKDNEFSTNN